MIYTTVTKTKCDARDCRENAVCYFETKGRGRCFLCARCLATLSAEARAHIVPKSPQNAINKKMRSRENEQNQ